MVWLAMCHIDMHSSCCNSKCYQKKTYIDFLVYKLLQMFNSVLVAKNDVVKISDFGTSREWNEKSTKMSFAGTVSWMAPEVIRNEPCNEKVDIW